MVTLILTHGMGAQDDKLEWFYSATSNWVPMKSVCWAAYYWEDLRNPPSKEDLAAGRKFGWRQWAPLSAFSDLLTYGSVALEAFKRLSDTLAAIDDDVILVAHSLGSVLFYQFLVDKLPFCSWKHKIKGFISLGSPLGRRPVSSRVKERFSVPWFKGLPKLPFDIPWVSISGGSDYVTSWFGGGIISEADTNMVVPFAGHDLTAYIGSKEFRQAVRGLVNQCG